MTANEYTRQHAEQFRRELHELLRIPSISTDMNFAHEMPRAADWLVDHLQRRVRDVCCAGCQPVGDVAQSAAC